MSKFPFTPQGVQDKLDELYALPDTDLILEASLIKADFRGWIMDSFLLNNDQKTFLSKMNDRACDYYGAQCELCFRYRLNITLIYPDPPTTPGYSKIPESTNTIRIASDDKGNIAVSGDLTFTMLYRM